MTVSHVFEDQIYQIGIIRFSLFMADKSGRTQVITSEMYEAAFLINQNIEKNRSPCYHVKADGNQIDSHLITESIKSGGFISPVSPLQA